MIWPGRKSVDDAVPAAPPPVMLQGPRILVRPPTALDVSSWIAVRRANRTMLEPLEPAWPEECLTPDFFARRLKRQTRDWMTDSAYSFLVILNGALIGGINLNHVARGAAQSASLGYWLDEAHHGKGYMREALAMVMDYSFNTLRFHRLNAACLPHNTRSISLLRGLGFADEGFARRYYRINGQWEDHVLFGYVREESAPTPSRPE